MNPADIANWIASSASWWLQRFSLDVRFEKPAMLLLIIPVVLILYFIIRNGKFRGRKLKFMLVRFFILSLLLIALASPYLIQSKRIRHEIPPITILDDASASMEIMSNESLTAAENLMKDLSATVGNLTQQSDAVKLETFSKGNRTELGDALYHNLIKTTRSNSLVVLVSDGNSNYGRNPIEVAKALRNANVTILSLAPEIEKPDVYISDVRGNKKTTAKSDYEITVVIGKTFDEKTEYKLRVWVDNEPFYQKVVAQKTETLEIPLTISFSTTGVHELKFSIEPDDDRFAENDVFYKAVDVVDKPRVLLITNNSYSALAHALGTLYQVSSTQSTDVDYRDYGAVVLDDLNANQFSKNDVDNLRDYLLDDNGLVVVGGKNSFEFGGYYNSYLENLLPVKSAEKARDRRKEIAVVFLIDVSLSTEYGQSENTKIDVEKALAIKMLRDLDARDSVGVLAFNTMPYVVAPIDKLENTRTDLEEKILRLQFGGGTDLLGAIGTAGEMLRYFTCSKYIVILSDGVIRKTRVELTAERVAELAKEGIVTHAIGVGFDTDEAVMKQLAYSGKGLYFKPEEYQRLRIEFGKEEEEAEKKTYPVNIKTRYHFITQNLDWDYVSVSDFNRVDEKSIAQVLLTSGTSQPLLTVWRFGLGRVAVLTTDNGELWGSELYTKDKGSLIGATTNWAIGDLEKSKSVRISSIDTNLGKTANFEVQTEKTPSVYLKHVDKVTTLSAEKIGLNKFKSDFSPESTGFYGLKASTQEGEDTDAVAVNYPDEYGSLGINIGTLARLSEITNGQFYTLRDLELLKSDILDYAKEKSVEDVKERKLLALYFVIAALALFFVDAVARRVYDILRLRKYRGG